MPVLVYIVGSEEGETVPEKVKIINKNNVLCTQAILSQVDRTRILLKRRTPRAIVGIRPEIKTGILIKMFCTFSVISPNMDYNPFFLEEGRVCSKSGSLSSRMGIAGEEMLAAAPTFPVRIVVSVQEACSQQVKLTQTCQKQSLLVNLSNICFSQRKKVTFGKS